MYHIIVNPTSSSGKGMDAWREIKDILDRRNVAYKVYILRKPGEATMVAGKLTAGRNMALNETAVMDQRKEVVRENEEDINILVIGGDGTLNEVLNGIQDFEHTTLSCIQTGSGNDFARNMHLEKNAEQAITHLLEQPEEIALDYGEVTTNHPGSDAKRFLISSGVGYDANICEEVSRSRLKAVLNKIHLGKLVYVLIGVKQIFCEENGTRKIIPGRCAGDEAPGVVFCCGYESYV